MSLADFFAAFLAGILFGLALDRFLEYLLNKTKNR